MTCFAAKCGRKYGSARIENSARIAYSAKQKHYNCSSYCLLLDLCPVDLNATWITHAAAN